MISYKIEPTIIRLKMWIVLKTLRKGQEKRYIRPLPRGPKVESIHSSKASSTASIAQNKSLQLQSCSEIAHEAFERERSQKLRFAVNVLEISRRRDPRDASAAYM
jgi:hypothetical protein